MYSHTFREVGKEIVHTQNKHYLSLGHPDCGTSRAGAWFSQLDMRLGRPDLPKSEIDDVNGKI